MFKIDEKGKWAIDGEFYQTPGFGTYPLKANSCFRAVTDALNLGYCIFDTATYYGNFIPLGRALKSAARSKIYLISKVWHDAQTPSKLQKDLQTTLKELQTDYLDAYLLHWPNSAIAIDATMAMLTQFKQQGLIRHIGIANVLVNHLTRLANLDLHVSCVQVEMNPYYCDFELLKYCQKNSIGLQAWAPLSRGRICNDALLTNIGNTYSKTASQVALKWIIQHGCLPLVGSQDIMHMQQNLMIHDFFLTENEMIRIDQRAKIGKRERVTKDEALGFVDEFDFSVRECWPMVEKLVL